VRNIHNLYLGIAEAVAKFGTCGRAQVGAIIVKDRKILGTGYNGAPSGEPHCTDVGCLIEVRRGKEHCIRTIHAEVNAIVNAREDVRGGTVYCTHEPCYDCLRFLKNAGIKTIYYRKSYPGEQTQQELIKKFDAHHLPDKGKDVVVSLYNILKSVEDYYNHPTIAPNGRAEGLCLSVRGLKGLIKQLTGR
jgi:dCMP deaminase